jgi:hypothetical protein
MARHTYCSNWITQYGDGEISLVKLSHQVGASVNVLRSTYVHLELADEDWLRLKTFGSPAPVNS